MAAEADDTMAMLLASEPPAMQAYRVSRAMNTPRNNQSKLHAGCLISSDWGANATPRYAKSCPPQKPMAGRT